MPPTGIAVGLNEIEVLLQRNSNKLVIVMKHRVDFGVESAGTSGKDYDNLLIVQTFSKSRALARLRIGFAIGNRDLIEALGAGSKKLL